MTATTEAATPACPRCGSLVVWDLTCHTYGSGNRFYACLPCDSAIRYSCDGSGPDDDWAPPECGWSYTHGLNPANPRAADNEADRPDWLEGDLAFDAGFPRRHPGIRRLGD